MKFNYDGFEDCLFKEFERENGHHWVFKLTDRFGASVIEENEYQHSNFDESFKDTFEIAMVVFIGNSWHIIYPEEIGELKYDVAHYMTQEETIGLLKKIKETFSNENRS